MIPGINLLILLDLVCGIFRPDSAQGSLSNGSLHSQCDPSRAHAADGLPEESV